MPYIPQRDREDVDPETGGGVPWKAGMLNFAITITCDRFIYRHGGPSYDIINMVIGVLESVKLELYRRIAAPYEDAKRAENGDVYSPENLTQVEGQE